MSGFGANLTGQVIDFQTGTRDNFSGSELLLSTGLGALGGRLATPLQDKFGATSLLFRKASPTVEELFFVPVTASGAAADVGQKLILKKASGR